MIELSENQPLRDEVFRKIGRNVANFQKLEGMLKGVLSLNNVSGTFEDIKTQVEANKNSAEQTTLGRLVGRFIEEICIEPLDAHFPDDGGDIMGHFQITMSMGDIEREELKSALQRLVDGRNSLVHEKLVKFNSQSDDSCLDMIKFLDSQHKDLKPAFAMVVNSVDCIIKHGEFLTQNSRAIAEAIVDEDKR